MTDATQILLCILCPAVGALALGLCGRQPNLRDGITLVTAGITLLLVGSLAPAIYVGQRPEISLGPLFAGIPFAFHVEPLGMLYALVASGLWIVTSVYAIGYMRGHHETHQTRFFVCFAVAISAALGIAFARNLMTLFVFYELLTFSTYPLVTHHGTPAAIRAGRVYLGILVFTSVTFLLFAIVWTWHLTGTLEFTPHGILEGRIEHSLVPVLLGLFAFGAGKAALMPLHRWLPNAMVAPTPVSALLHAVAVVKAGVFTILKVIVYIFGTDLLARTHASEWLMYVAAATILIAAVIAIREDNLKARLAYSTISHLSYIVLGASLASDASTLGSGLHIAMHAMGKITLFFCAGAIYVAAHKTKVSELNGIGYKMPFTMAAFFLGSLSLIGLPPFGGMWSKWYLALGAAKSDHLFFVLVFMASSVLSIAYLIPVVARAFFLRPATAEGEVAESGSKGASFWSGVQEAPLMCVVPLCLTALGSLLLFFLAEPIFRLLLSITSGGS